MPKDRIYTCKEHDVVLHQGKPWSVQQVLSQGSEEREVRADVSACPIMPDNFQVLTRSCKYLGDDWRHLTVKAVMAQHGSQVPKTTKNRFSI